MNKRQSGQTLVTLLVFMAVALVLTASATAVAIVNVQAGQRLTLGETALQTAGAGAENALRRLLTNPQYTGETLTVGSGTAIITVSGSTTKTIISEGVIMNARRKIQVTATYTNTVLTVTEWKETP